MSAASLKSSRTTSAALISATSSPASASGPSACATPAGQTIDLFGPGHAPAAPSAPPANAKASTTRATYGRNGFGSSASAGLSSSLVSNLIKRSRGSILFNLTWKATVTPSGRLLYLLRASEARTGATALASWPTPTTPSGGQSVPPGTTATGRRPDGSKATVTLEMVARAAGWGTPTALSRPRTEETLEKCLTFRRGNGQNSVPLYLEEQARLASWATPAWRDYRTPNLEPFADRGGGKKGEQLSNQVIHSGPALIGSSAEIAAGARLNPALARWLMRVPPVWDACAVTATPSTSRRSRP